MIDQTLYPTQTVELKIIAPIGGFANHVRWLILLDSSYSFYFCPTQNNYEIFAGPSWPTYKNYCVNNLQAIQQEVMQEITQITKDNQQLKVYNFSSTDDKKNFIDQYVYPQSRTWQNWLNFEWQFRTALNQAIVIDHGIKSDTGNLPGIYIDIEPDYALRQYIKFNSNLNNLTFDQFKKIISRFKADLDKVDATKNLIIDALELNQSTLEPELYARIARYIGIAGNYDLANYAHKKWYNLHRRAEKEIGQFFTCFYQ